MPRVKYLRMEGFSFRSRKLDQIFPFPTCIPVSVLLDVVEAGVLEDEPVVAPGWVGVVDSVKVHDLLQELGSQSTVD